MPAIEFAQVDTKELKRLQTRLKAISDGMPDVVSEALNRVGTVAHIQSIRNMRERFVLRNKYTEGSARYYPAKPKSKWERINVISGHISPYMDVQDSGGERKPKQGKKVAMPTLYSRAGSGTRKKLRRFNLGQHFNPNFLRSQFVGKPKGQGKNANKPSGIYERTDKNTKIRMTHNLANETWKVKRTRWHTDAMAKYARQDYINAVFIQEARRYLRKYEG